MRLAENAPPKTHQHLIENTIDPADWHRLENLIGEAREIRLLHLEEGKLDRWIAQIICASEQVRRMDDDC